MKNEHLIGKKIQNLIIRNIIPYYRKNRPNQRDYKAEVYCELCKNNKIINLRGLIDNTTKSCGCLNKIRKKGLNNKLCLDLRGKKFGMLSPVEIDENRKGRVYWKCFCDCGKSKTISSKNLTLGLTTSCGCKTHRTGKINPSWKGYEEISGNQWNWIVRGAKNRNLEFTISIEYIWNLFIKQNKKCALTGLPLIFRSRSDITDGTASLDRIDSTKGYIEGNVQWVHKDVNTVKWDLTLDNFFKVCKLVVEYNKL